MTHTPSAPVDMRHGVGRVSDEWNVSPSGYPERGSTPEKLRFLLRFALLAPSNHNTQPWWFQLRNNELELYADRARALTVSDPEDRELVISCGCALFHLRTAMRFFGRTDRIRILPRVSDPDLLARITLGDVRVPSTEECALFQSITRRHTNRRAFEKRPVPGGVLSMLQAEAHAEGAWLHIIEDEHERSTAADLIAQADRDQAADDDFRAELAAWMRDNEDNRRDGIPGYTLGMGDIASRVGPLLVRTFDWGDGKAARDRQLAEGSPALVVLGTEEDETQDWVAAGQALSAVLLHACSEGVSASFLNQVVQVRALRSALADCLRLNGFPQIVMRLGYGEPVSPTPRRPVEAILTE